jgi:hypothetical protein
MLIVLAEKLETKYPELVSMGQVQTEAVGAYLASVSKFLLGRMSVASQPKAIANLRQKLYAIDDNELSKKKMPGGAAIGSAITLVKSVLRGADPTTIRAIINSTVAHL